MNLPEQRFTWSVDTLRVVKTPLQPLVDVFVETVTQDLRVRSDDHQFDVLASFIEEAECVLDVSRIGFLHIGIKMCLDQRIEKFCDLFESDDGSV